MNISVKSGFTYEDRYPQLFLASTIFPNKGNILSYGCSTGEEAGCLKDKYFKKSCVYGTDIDNNRLEVARSKYKEVTFLNLYDMNSMVGMFDIIFCMNVFSQYTSGVDMWKSDILKVCDYLNDNGVLCIQNCKYKVDEKLTDFLHPIDMTNSSHLVKGMGKPQFDGLYDNKWRTHIFYRKFNCNWVKK